MAVPRRLRAMSTAKCGRLRSLAAVGLARARLGEADNLSRGTLSPTRYQRGAMLQPKPSREDKPVSADPLAGIPRVGECQPRGRRIQACPQEDSLLFAYWFFSCTESAGLSRVQVLPSLSVQVSNLSSTMWKMFPCLPERQFTSLCAPSKLDQHPRRVSRWSR